MVFQEHCLFPNLNVEENIRFGIGKENKAQKDSIVKEMLSLVELKHKKKSYPDELSGGEQKRIAIARALAAQPKMILMDEPFSGLDEDVRAKLRREVKKIFKSLEMTALIVTHSQEEAFEIGDRFTLLGDRKKYQTGSFAELREFPVDPFFVHFLNSGFFIDGKFNTKSQQVLTPWGPFGVQNKEGFANLADRQGAKIFVPYNSLSLFASHGENPLKAKLVNKIPQRWGFLYEFQLENRADKPLLLDLSYLSEDKGEGLEKIRGLNVGSQIEFYFKNKAKRKWVAFRLIRMIFDKVYT